MEAIRRAWSGLKWSYDGVNAPLDVGDDIAGGDVASAMNAQLAQLIAMAPTDIRFLLQRCRRLERELTDLRQLKIWKEKQRASTESKAEQVSDEGRAQPAGA